MVVCRLGRISLSGCLRIEAVRSGKQLEQDIVLLLRALKLRGTAGTKSV